MNRARTRRRKRRTAGSYPLRVAGATTLLFLATWALVLVGQKAAHPYWIGYQESRKVASLHTELKQQRARNALLREELRFLRSDEGGESLARENGYQMPGEEVILLTDPAKKPATPFPEPVPPAPLPATPQPAAAPQQPNNAANATPESGTQP